MSRNRSAVYACLFGVAFLAPFVALAEDRAALRPDAPLEAVERTKQAEDAPEGVAKTLAADPQRWFRYTSKGLEVGSKDGAFSARINGRSQLRFSAPFVSAPRKPSHFDRENDNDMRFRHARLKADGHLGKSWIEYKYEHDLVRGNLLDLRFDIGPEWLKLRVGQWKADYSRERIDSSGKQQFAERSIVNRAFTLDRQKGAMAVGRLGKGTVFDTQYYAGFAIRPQERLILAEFGG